MTVALYPGSFDPITNGHLDIAIRASRLFETLIIGVYDIPAKNLMFNTQERVELVRQSIKEAKLKNVRAEAFNGLVVDYAKKLGAQTIVRGLRVVGDFENEFSYALMNRQLAPDVDVVCLLASMQFQFLSSSLLKEVAILHGNTEQFVPGPVVKALNKKLNMKK